MAHPEKGARVYVRPRHGLQVQRGHNLFQQYLAQAGQHVLWDDYLASRHGEGVIEICAAPPEPVGDEAVTP